MKTRKCRTCSEHKPLSQMTKHAGSRDGVINICNACRREQDYFRVHGVERPKDLTLVFKLIAGVEHKRCPTCSEYKTYDNFYKHKKGTNGIYAKCISCCARYKASDEYKDILKRKRINLNDLYVRNLLAKRSRLKGSEFPQELVDVKREVIRIQRFIQENNV
jgi:hypothetical protein